MNINKLLLLSPLVREASYCSEWHQCETHNLSVLGMIVECSALNRTYTSTLQSLRSTAEEEAERMQELEDGEECCEMMLSSEHGMTIALMNSQELWLPAQNQTSQHSSIEGS